METQLGNMTIEDLDYVERDLNFQQKVSLSFLLFGDQHAHATYILQKLLVLGRASAADQANSDLLRQYTQINSGDWRGPILEALCIIDARRVLRKLGFNWSELCMHYLPHTKEIALHVHPLLKAMYIICEQLTVAECGRLVTAIDVMVLQCQSRSDTASREEQLEFYDLSYVEIFLLKWLTQRHLQLGDINAMGSDVQLLIEYLKINDYCSLATILVQTINVNNLAGVKPENVVDIKPDAEVSQDSAAAVPNPKHLTPVRNYRVRQESAGILLIINQQDFHRDVSPDLVQLLPKMHLTKREGTDMDKKRLIEVFTPLGYTVEAHDNVDHMDILSLIRGACDRSMLRDSLIVCILSHGFNGAVYGCDSIAISIVDIQNVLCANMELSEKPKILILQACQQNEKQSDMRDMNVNTNTATQHVNLVVAMSTVPGFVSLRHSLEGTWFIQTLCETIAHRAHSEHILDIFTETFFRVTQKRGSKNQLMVPVVNSTLRQPVYLPQIQQCGNAR